MEATKKGMTREAAEHWSELFTQAMPQFHWVLIEMGPENRSHQWVEDGYALFGNDHNMVSFDMQRAGAGIMPNDNAMRVETEIEAGFFLAGVKTGAWLAEYERKQQEKRKAEAEVVARAFEDSAQSWETKSATHASNSLMREHARVQAILARETAAEIRAIAAGERDA